MNVDVERIPIRHMGPGPRPGGRRLEIPVGPIEPNHNSLFSSIRLHRRPLLDWNNDLFLWRVRPENDTLIAVESDTGSLCGLAILLLCGRLSSRIAGARIGPGISAGIVVASSCHQEKDRDQEGGQNGSNKAACAAGSRIHGRRRILARARPLRCKDERRSSGEDAGQLEFAGTQRNESGITTNGDDEGVPIRWNGLKGFSE
jgi:hypothetical protein